MAAANRYLLSADEYRAKMSTAEINDLPDSDFAYIEDGGEKDEGGKTTPRSLRHYPIQDKAHADNALSRANAQIEGDDEDAKAIAEKALPAIKAAVKKFADEVESKSAAWNAQKRDDDMSYGDLMDLLSTCVSDKFCSSYDDYCWVCDFSDTWVVFSKNGERYQASYTMDGNDVTLGDAELVREVTTYVPIESKARKIYDAALRAAEDGFSLRLGSTPEDAEVLSDAVTALESLHATKKAQMDDPDTETDPADAAFCAHLESSITELKAAIVKQAVDMAGDDVATAGRSNTTPAVPKRSFSSLTERPIPNFAQIRVGDLTSDATAGVPFVGYASTTGTAYSVRDWLGEYNETISPGAFAKTLREQESIPLLQNHDANLVLANTSSKTSSLAEDANGLRNDANINPEYTQLIVGMRRGDINKMSFSFRAIKDTWNDDYDDRSVNELALYDTSIVTYPANPSTSAELLDEFRSVMGREGVALAWSIRSAISSGSSRVDQAAEPLLESAIRALALSDETLCRRSSSYALQGRARTFLVAGALEQLRKGASVSSKNLALVNAAMQAISDATDAHDQMVASHSAAQAALSSVVNSSVKQGSSNDDATEANGETTNGASQGDGLDAGATNAPGGNGAASDANEDGLGVRKVPASVVRAQRELALLKLG